jgi:hypothetical protein
MNVTYGDRFDLLREHGFERSRDCFESLSALVQTQPNLEAIVKVLGTGLHACEDFRSNTTVANQMRERLLDIACFLDVAAHKNDVSKAERLNHYVEHIMASLSKANKYLLRYTRRGFLGILLAGDKPVKRFADIDTELIKRVGGMSANLQLTNAELKPYSYEVICNIEEWVFDNGGIGAIAENDAKFGQLVSKLGTRFTRIGLPFLNC